MSELDSMKPRVVKALKPLHAFCVENRVGAGTPDVNYTEGWIELKWMRSWPKRGTTIVKIEHYTKQQKIFAVKRRRAGGNCWLLLQVKQQWLLFDGAVAAIILNKKTAKELFHHAYKVWPHGLKDQELIECISQTQKAFTFCAEDFN